MAERIKHFDAMAMLSSRRTYLRAVTLSLVFIILWRCFSSDLHTHLYRNDSTSITRKPFPFETLPTVARVLYLFLCENQAEIDAYRHTFPSITADVMFFCWKENCVNTSFSPPGMIYSRRWTGRTPTHQPFVRLRPAFDYLMIQSRVFIVNEHQLQLPHKTTWTTARNILLDKAMAEEQRQGWRWAYFTFGDGDIKAACPQAQELLRKNRTSGDEVLIVPHFRFLLATQQSRFLNVTYDPCFIFFDAFLLSASPAIGVIASMGVPILFDGLLSQVVYHVDAMLNAVHRDAVPLLLPYCPRYDNRTWWTSQAILVYRSLCVFGHVVQLNVVHAVQQKHRTYPREGDPWAIDQDMNLVPLSLIPLQTYMKQARAVSALCLQHYSGWSLGLTSDECRSRHSSVNPVTCKVG